MLLPKCLLLRAISCFITHDFLLSRGTKLHPIEVKSSGYNSHVSLDVFCEKFSHVVDKRYLIYTKDLKRDEKTLLLPVYMAIFL